MSKEQQINGVLSHPELLKGIEEVRKYIHDTHELDISEKKYFLMVIDQANNHISKETIILYAAKEVIKIFEPLVPKDKVKNEKE